MNLVVEGVEVEVHGAGGDHSQPHSVPDLSSVVDLEIYSVSDFIIQNDTINELNVLSSSISRRAARRSHVHKNSQHKTSIEKPIQNKEIMEKGL